MGIRGGVPGFSGAMAHLSYDFLRQVHYPGTLLSRITLSKVGRTSMEHAIEMWHVSAAPCLAGRGRAIHVWVDRETGKPTPWPTDVLAKCWDPALEMPET